MRGRDLLYGLGDRPGEARRHAQQGTRRALHADARPGQAGLRGGITRSNVCDEEGDRDQEDETGDENKVD